MCRKILLGLLAAVLAFFFAAEKPASAATRPQQNSITVGQAAQGSAYGYKLTVNFDHPISQSAANRVKTALSKGSVAGSAQQEVPSAARGGAYLYCDRPYAFADSDGTFYFQHACGGSTGPWGYQISNDICDIVVGDVSEAGMSWSRNGVAQGRQSPHVEGCPYKFHGTFNPDMDYDFITYSDVYSFEVNIDGQQGNATLDIHGSFTSSGCSKLAIFGICLLP